MLGQRVLIAVIGIPLLVAIVGFGPAWLFVGLVVVLALVGQWELYRMFARVGVTADGACSANAGAAMHKITASSRALATPVMMASSEENGTACIALHNDLSLHGLTAGS